MLAILVLLAGACSCYVDAPHRDHRTAIPHLYAYGTDDLAGNVEALTGYKLSEYFLESAQRDSSGTALRLTFRSQKKSQYSVVILMGRRFHVVKAPEPDFALNDSEQVVAWWYDLSREGIHFRNGKIAKATRQPVFDPGGRYCSYVTLDETSHQASEIVSSDRADVSLATVKFLVRKLFVKDENLYVFGSSHQTENVLCSIFRVAGSRLLYSNDILIQRPSSAPSPFYVEDADPWSSNVLLTDVYDPPLRNSWLLFNFETGRLANLGTADAPFGFFMQGDVFDAQLEKKR
jgi:hypothetical protein